MKRLLLVAVMVLVTLVGMVGLSHAGNEISTLEALAKATNEISTLEALAKVTTEAVSTLQAVVNPWDYYDPKEAVIEPPATVNAGTEYNWTAYYYPNNGAVTEPPATVNAGVPAQRKMYYLTLTSFTGDDAIMACDSGFHMASLSEIQDPSSVQYATRSTTSSITVYDSIAALVDSPPPTRSTTRRATVYDSIVALVDSPPLTGSTTGRTPAYDSTYEFVPFDQASDQFPDHTGWVRAGDGLSGVVQDQDNCDLWKSSSAQQSGTTMTRRSLWGENNGHSLYEESDPAAWWQSTQTASCSQPEPVWCVEDPVMRSAICTGTIDQQSGDCS